MALSDYEKHLVFEVFEIPNSASVLYIDTLFGTGRTSNATAILSSRTEILAKIDALDTTLQTRLSELLAEWKRVSTKGVRLEPNNANEGVNVNFARERRLIRDRIFTIVPIVRGTSDGGPGRAGMSGGIPLG